MNRMTSTMDSPLGMITLVTEGPALCALRFEARNPEVVESSHPVASQIRAYFAGDAQALDAIPVAAQGTEFQRQVWAELRRIAPGQTLSYRELAERIGHPKAVRAVGAANGANPIALVVPCHRVIGSDGKLTGYAYGLERKQWLLQHEGALQSAAT